MTNKKHWKPDSSTMRCTKCKRKFGVFFRKHHCRSCGFIFCNSCSKTKGQDNQRRCFSCALKCSNCNHSHGANGTCCTQIVNHDSNCNCNHAHHKGTCDIITTWSETIYTTQAVPNTYSIGNNIYTNIEYVKVPIGQREKSKTCGCISCTCQKCNTYRHCRCPKSTNNNGIVLGYYFSL
jgi:hypothetical protein